MFLKRFKITYWYIKAAYGWINRLSQRASEQRRGLWPRDPMFTACHPNPAAGVAKTPIPGSCIHFRCVIGDLHRKSGCRGLIPDASRRSLRWRFEQIRIVGSEVRAQGSDFGHRQPSGAISCTSAMETSNSQRRTRWQVQFARHQPRWVRPAGVSWFLGFGAEPKPLQRRRQ